MWRPLRHPARALAAMVQVPRLSILAVASLAAALLLLGAYGMVLVNLRHVAAAWGRGSLVSCILHDDTAPTDWEAARRALAALPGVERATVVSPAAALARFAARGPDAAALVAGVEPAALPATVDLALARATLQPPPLAALLAAARQVPQVAEIDDGGEEQAFVRDVVRAARAVGIAFGLLMAITTACMVGSTVRLAVHQRRDEVAILQLVGATRAFIAAPFVLQGAAWGLAGGAIAALLLRLAHLALAAPLTAAASGLTGGVALALSVPALPWVLMGAGACGSVAVSIAATRSVLARGLT